MQVHRILAASLSALLFPFYSLACFADAPLPLDDELSQAMALKNDVKNGQINEHNFFDE